MSQFQVTILGCGSAMPTTLHNPPSQLVNMNGKLFMIDCGEGTQLQMRKFKARMSKLQGLFISHLHGDHFFGLPGLITTLSMLGRTNDLDIYAHGEIRLMLNPLLMYLGHHMQFKINLIPLNPEGHELLLEDESIRISTFPLKHRIPANGFRFEVKKSPRRILREKVDRYQVPVEQLRAIKEGADFVAVDGTVVSNNRLTTPGNPSRAYAYCSDTAYHPGIVPYIKGVDLLFHEATFAESERERAAETYHSTAREAAEIAKMAEVKRLVIGHYSSRYNEIGILLKEAVETFPNSELAVEGKVFDL
ncbi:MAG: ribonuclease Z [Bacteroidota bacterium]|jgi:ribonuclease Z|nr:ribonuclease Z [Bacteroidota bacterium]HHU96739.1 ribonuclease Z [Petrimonas sp.]